MLQVLKLCSARSSVLIYKLCNICKLQVGTADIAMQYIPQAIQLHEQKGMLVLCTTNYTFIQAKRYALFILNYFGYFLGNFWKKLGYFLI